jgi:hypothetical protein
VWISARQGDFGGLRRFGAQSGRTGSFGLHCCWVWCSDQIAGLYTLLIIFLKT